MHSTTIRFSLVSHDGGGRSYAAQTIRRSELGLQHCGHFGALGVERSYKGCGCGAKAQPIARYWAGQGLAPECSEGARKCKVGLAVECWSGAWQGNGRALGGPAVGSQEGARGGCPKGARQGTGRSPGTGHRGHAARRSSVRYQVPEGRATRHEEGARQRTGRVLQGDGRACDKAPGGRAAGLERVHGKVPRGRAVGRREGARQGTGWARGWVGEAAGSGLGESGQRLGQGSGLGWQRTS